MQLWDDKVSKYQVAGTAYRQVNPPEFSRSTSINQPLGTQGVSVTYMILSLHSSKEIIH
jgi:hypothetical protein